GAPARPAAASSSAASCARRRPAGLRGRAEPGSRGRLRRSSPARTRTVPVPALPASSSLGALPEATLPRYDRRCQDVLSDRLRALDWQMTFAQLQSFAMVARLGSVHAAAKALGVSEPAVSAAVAALRRDLGDDLFVRSGSGIALTAGGGRLAARAAEILGLAHQVRRELDEARGESAFVS